MDESHKFWFWGAVAAMLAVASAFVAWMLVPTSPKLGTASPPPGPHQAGDLWLADLGGRTTVAMVWCPPGKFLMGSPVTEKGREPIELNETQHEVTLTRGFWIGQTEVTQEQWQAVMGNNPSEFPSKRVVTKRFLRWEIPVWRRDFLVSRQRLPVENVGWNDCQDFCRKAGSNFRLPTEAQWEYACRAGWNSPLSQGPVAGSGVLDEMAWYSRNGERKTHKVGLKRPNAWGLYDMYGNVAEWCQDKYGGYNGDYPEGPAVDPIGRCDPFVGNARVFRGGSWVDSAAYCRSANRYGDDCPEQGFDKRGFRLAFFADLPAPVDERRRLEAESHQGEEDRVAAANSARQRQGGKTSTVKTSPRKSTKKPSPRH